VVKTSHWCCIQVGVGTSHIQLDMVRQDGYQDILSGELKITFLFVRVGRKDAEHNVSGDHKQVFCV